MILARARMLDAKLSVLYGRVRFTYVSGVGESASQSRVEMDLAKGNTTSKLSKKGIK